jgi:cation diffusion facilitator family transporter
MAVGSSVNDPLPSERIEGTFTVQEARQAKRLTIVLVIIALFFGLELAGALVARSNVLKADALHLMMDVFALAMSLLAMRLAVRRPTPRFTFGLRRAEPVAAIFNAMLVLGATIEIVRDGIEQLRGTGGEPPQAGLMLIVSIGALCVNGLSAWLLHDVIGHAGHDHGAHGHGGHGHKAHAHDHEHAHDHAHEHEHAHDHGVPVAKKLDGHQLNLRSARLHLLGDTLGSLAALVAAIAIRMGGPASIDAIASFAVALILVLGAFGLLRDATLVLLEASPKHLQVDAVRRVMESFPKVVAVHDMHVWTLGAGHDAITVHVRVSEPDPEIGRLLAKKLRDTFSAEYVTVQVEVEGEACAAPPSLFEG